MGYIAYNTRYWKRLLALIRLFILALLSFPVIARDSDLQVQAAEIVGYGEFKTASQKTHRGFTGTAIAADTVTGIQFTEFTKEIVATLGTNFGFQYIINTSPRGKTMSIRSVIKFPAPGLQKPGGKLYVESVEQKEVRIGQPSLHGYGFDEEWELVPGEWVFEIWYRKARIIKQTFTVIAPAPEQ